MTCTSLKKFYADGFLNYNKDMDFFPILGEANRARGCQQKRSTK